MRQLFLGGFEEILPTIGFVDAVFTDPPYGVTQAQCDTPFNLKLFWQLIETVKRRPGVPVLTFCNQPFTTDLINSNRTQFKYCWYWVKNNKTGFAGSHRAPLRQLEEIAVFYALPIRTYNNVNLRFDPAKSRRKPCGNPLNLYGGKSKISIKNSLINTRLHTGYSGFNSNVLFFDKPNTTTQYRNHPFQKPVDLLEFLIKVYTDEGGVVLDPFMGSGSTGVACKNLNRNFIGIEIDPEYFASAQSRIESS
jgi:site-specific DNA-methyltransferase (adenine-specific)